MVAEVCGSVVDDKTVDAADKCPVTFAVCQVREVSGAAASYKDVPLCVEDLVGARAGPVVLVVAVQTDGQESAGPQDGERMTEVVIDLLAEGDRQRPSPQLVLHVGVTSHQGYHQIVVTSAQAARLSLAFPEQQSVLL